MIETFHFKLRPVRLKLFYSTVDCFVDSKTLSRLKIFLIIVTIQIKIVKNSKSSQLTSSLVVKTFNTQSHRYPSLSATKFLMFSYFVAGTANYMYIFQFLKPFVTVFNLTNILFILHLARLQAIEHRFR